MPQEPKKPIEPPSRPLRDIDAERIRKERGDVRPTDAPPAPPPEDDE